MVGRPKKYLNEEDRNQAIQQCKNKYLRNKEWICLVCGNHDCHIQDIATLYSKYICFCFVGLHAFFLLR